MGKVKNRIFLGIPLSNESREDLLKKLTSVPGKIVNPEKWHFTLQFLGDIEDSKIKELATALKNQDFGGPFDCDISHLNAFPNQRSAKILWFGISKGTSEFNRLVEKLNLILSQLRIVVDDRPFVPHLTISRLITPTNITQWLLKTKIKKTTVEIKQICIYHSILDAHPPHYQNYQIIDKILL